MSTPDVSPSMGRANPWIWPWLAGVLLAAACGADGPLESAPPPAGSEPPGSFLELRSVHVGFRTTCGLAADGTAYCWGWESAAGLGRARPTTPALCPTLAGPIECRTTPVRVEAGPWAALHNGGTPCALSPEGHVYCWGVNAYGERGVDGSQQAVWSPNRIAEAPVFATLGTGAQFACGLTADGEAHCWGGNHRGQLGNGEVRAGGGMRPTPVPVLGGHRFAAISASDGPGSPRGFTCAVTAEGAAYCWGTNPAGQLGIGVADTLPYVVPQRVRTGVPLRSVTAGSVHACGLDDQGQAHCWGSNFAGALGRDPLRSPRCDTPLYQRDPSGGYFFEGPCHTEPIAVETSLRFASLSAGLNRTCGITPTGHAYCWGRLRQGPDAWLHTAEPVGVGGAHRFRQLDASFGDHVCGVALDDAVYCWGPNSYGQLGDGSMQGSAAPVRVVAPR